MYINAKISRIFRAYNFFFSKYHNLLIFYNNRSLKFIEEFAIENSLMKGGFILRSGAL